jgi:hypothetical protein
VGNPSPTEQVNRFRILIATEKLRAGMRRDEVIALLGEPDDVGGFSPRSKLPGIYKYGVIEIHFGKLSVDGLFLVFTEYNIEKPITLLHGTNN